MSEDKRCQKNQSAKMDLMILQDNDYIKPMSIGAIKGHFSVLVVNSKEIENLKISQNKF